MRKLVYCIPALLAAACSTTAATPVDQIPVHGEVPGYVCRKPGDREFVGQLASPELGARMLAEARARTIRWVPFGSMITMDFSPSRLTVRLDQQNRVLSMTCG